MENICEKIVNLLDKKIIKDAISSYKISNNTSLLEIVQQNINIEELTDEFLLKVIIRLTYLDREETKSSSSQIILEAKKLLYIIITNQISSINMQIFSLESRIDKNKQKINSDENNNLYIHIRNRILHDTVEKLQNKLIQLQPIRNELLIKIKEQEQINDCDKDKEDNNDITTQIIIEILKEQISKEKEENNKKCDPLRQLLIEFTSYAYESGFDYYQVTDLDDWKKAQKKKNALPTLDILFNKEQIGKLESIISSKENLVLNKCNTHFEIKLRDDKPTINLIPFKRLKNGISFKCNGVLTNYSAKELKNYYKSRVKKLDEGLVYRKVPKSIIQK